MSTVEIGNSPKLDFIKIACRRLICRYDVPDSPVLPELAAAAKLAASSRPILIHGYSDMETRGLAEAIAEFNPQCTFPKVGGFIEFSCLTNDAPRLEAVMAKGTGPETTVFINNIDRPDGGVDPILNCLIETLQANRPEAPRIICASTAPKGLIPSITDKRTEFSFIWQMNISKLRETLQRALGFFRKTSLGLPHISRRLWDVAPLVVHFLQGRPVGFISLNALDLATRCPWYGGIVVLQQVIADAASAAGSTGTITFQHIKDSFSPSEYAELLSDIESSDTSKPRSSWLDSSWLAEVDAETRVSGEIIDFARGGAVRFDIKKMNRIFRKLGILPGPQGRKSRTVSSASASMKRRGESDYPDFLRDIRDETLRQHVQEVLHSYIELYRKDNRDDPYAQKLKERTDCIERNRLTNGAMKSWKGHLMKSTVRRKYLYPWAVIQWGAYLERLAAKR